MIARILALTAALTLVAPASAAGGDDPKAYAVQVPVTPAPGASLQRLDLPARVLVAARSAELADVRVFDAAGQSVPIALATTPAPQQRQSVSLPVLPILGAADALAVTGVTLKIDDGKRASVLRVDGTPPGGGASQLLGVLLDTRRIADPVSALALEVATPAGQPVTFRIESSSDLQDWQPLADKVVYRAAGPTGSTTIDFPTQDLRGRYLRVTWQAGSQLLSPASVRTAAAMTLRNAGSEAPRAVLALPDLPDHHVITLTLPFPAPIAALEITPAGGDALVPVRILGRDNPEEPWSPIATGSVFRVTSRGQTRANSPIDLHGTRFRTLRIEADQRTAGFTAAPTIAARLEPAQIVFLASGPAPFTLAAGRTDAVSAFLPLDDLAQANGTADTATLPTATIPAAADPIVPLLAAEQGPPWRRIGLWGVLLAGTALLAAMVRLLVLRRPPAA